VFCFVFEKYCVIKSASKSNLFVTFMKSMVLCLREKKNVLESAPNTAFFFFKKKKKKRKRVIREDFLLLIRKK
jgi:hypothetical protein